MAKAATVTTTRARRRRSLQQWRAGVFARERSGLTQKAFREQEGISVVSLLNWRRRFCEEQAEGVGRVLPEFVDIGPMMAPASGALTLRLDLGAGLALTVTRS